VVQRLVSSSDVVIENFQVGGIGPHEHHRRMRRAAVEGGVAIVDVLCGVHAAVGILAALTERARTGTGRRLEVSLLDAALGSLVNVAQAAITPARRRGVGQLLALDRRDRRRGPGQRDSAADRQPSGHHGKGRGHAPKRPHRHILPPDSGTRRDDGERAGPGAGRRGAGRGERWAGDGDDRGREPGDG
jgi:hypothetical protein